MEYLINHSSDKSIYIQLYDALRADIISGALKKGDKLPSKRVIAEELGISVITVEHAYALLCDEGYIQAQERSGYYVSFGADMNPEYRAPSAPAAAAVQTDFPFSSLAKTMRRVILDYDRLLLVKSPNCGCIEFRRAIAAYLARSRGISVKPEQIIVGSGAEYLYGIAVQLLGRERTFALEDPSYEKIRRVYEANGAQCTMLPLGEDGIKSSALDGCSAGVLHVTPYNSYPSGVTATAAKRYEYAAWAKANDAYIIEDDYDSEFSSALRRISTIFTLDPERVIYINTFSRTIGSGIRIGYMLLPETLAARYSQQLDFYSCTVPVYEQYVLADFIDSGEFERHINRIRRRLRQSAAK